MNLTVKEQTEYKRIKNGPQSGYFTFLHHEVFIEQSSNVMERICYIVENKLANEIFTRLRHIWPVSSAMKNAYDAAVKTAGDAYCAAVKPAGDAHYAAVKTAEDVICKLVPNCHWNGKTILE